VLRCVGDVSPLRDLRGAARTKTIVAVALGGTIACLLAAFGAIYAVNTLLDHAQTEHFTVGEPVARLVVASDAGNIDVLATATNRVIVHQTTHWVTTQPTPTRTVSGGVLRLADDCRGWTTFRCDTEYQIEVPGRLGVEVHANAGNVTIHGTGGPVTVDSDAGDVHATGLTAARVQASRVAGDVRLAFATAPSWIDEQTDAGEVDIELPHGEYAPTPTPTTDNRQRARQRDRPLRPRRPRRQGTLARGRRDHPRPTLTKSEPNGGRPLGRAGRRRRTTTRDRAPRPGGRIHLMGRVAQPPRTTRRVADTRDRQRVPRLTRRTGRLPLGRERPRRRWRKCR
jgi:hypothetical protein